MSNKYPLIAAAVAVAVASGAANAAVPTIAQAGAPNASLVIAGSSAAAPAVQNFVQNQICNGAANTLTISSVGSTKNFLAYSCQIPTQIDDPNGVGSSIPAGSVVTVYYRTEGGSVVGALPVATGKAIKRLAISTANCTTTGATTATCTVGGTTTQAGTLDTWTTAVANDTVQLGVTDVEPAQLTNQDYPSNYSASAFGSATTGQMQGLVTSPAVQQVFGLFVNTSGQGFSSVNISKESAANLLNGTYTNWNKVPDATTGAALTTASHPVTRINREPGSGTRTSANIYFLNYQCGSTNFMPPRSGEVLNFSTGDELSAINSTPGAIGYASIDNWYTAGKGSTQYPNLVLVSLNGVTPSNLAAATGAYDFWYEATFVPNPSLNAGSTASTLSNFIQQNAPDIGSVPSLADINAIPFAAAGNTPGLPLSAHTNGGAGTATVYVSPFSRSSNSCNVPAALN
jgi:ABC-type phosphate transport system substrate-binding protein